MMAPPIIVNIFFIVYKLFFRLSLFNSSLFLLNTLSNSSDFIPIPESSIEIINLHISCFLTHETLSSTYPLFVYFMALSRREINIFLRLILSPYIYSGRSLAIFDLNSMLLHFSLYVVIICFKISLILYLVLYTLIFAASMLDISKSSLVIVLN